MGERGSRDYYQVSCTYIYSIADLNSDLIVCFRILVGVKCFSRDLDLMILSLRITSVREQSRCQLFVES